MVDEKNDEKWTENGSRMSLRMGRNAARRREQPGWLCRSGDQAGKMPGNQSPWLPPWLPLLCRMAPPGVMSKRSRKQRVNQAWEPKPLA